MSFIDKIFGGGIKDVVTGISDIADKYITTPDEKKAFQLEVERMKTEKEKQLIDSAQAEMSAYLKDVQDARGTNVQIQTTEKAGWLAKNIAYLIDVIVTLLWAALTTYIIMRVLNILSNEKQPDMSVVLGIYAAITGQFTTVLSFHRGSSAGSSSKDKTIQKLTQEVGV